MCSGVIKPGRLRRIAGPVLWIVYGVALLTVIPYSGDSLLGHRIGWSWAAFGSYVASHWPYSTVFGVPFGAFMWWNAARARRDKLASLDHRPR